MRDPKKCERCGKEYMPQSQAYEVSRFCSRECTYATLNGDKARDRIAKLHAKWAAESPEETRGHMRKYLEERVVKGKRPNDCWGWSGSIVNGVSVYATAKFRGKSMTAAKMSYIAYKDDLAKGEAVSRICESPVCINPEHLYVASRMITRKCEFCGKEFTVRFSQPHRYCSDSCRNTVRSREKVKTNWAEVQLEPFELTRSKLRKRLESLSKKEDGGCWLWIGNTKKGTHNYGRIKVRRKNLIASRASWIAYNGEIPDGMCVCHKCDTPRCINPDHLFLGTDSDNQQDRFEKKRACAKLTEKDVIEIKKKIALEIPFTKIAVKYGVSASTIRKIKKGKTWRDV